jgi:CRP-like cAMP-binding protein
MAAPVRGNLLLAALPERIRGAAAEHFERVTFSQGESFYQDGDHLRHAWFVEHGLVSLVTTLSDGFTVENTAVGREGVVGLTPDLRPSRAFGAAIGQTPGEAVRVELGRVRELALADDDFRRALSLVLDQITTHSRQSAACLARHDVHQRLCRWLLRCHDKMGDQPLPVTQEFLGHMLGTRRSTVSMVAGALEKAGLIRYSRGLISVRDRRGLEARSCECYASLRRRAAELGLEPAHS